MINNTFVYTFESTIVGEKCNSPKLVLNSCIGHKINDSNHGKKENGHKLL